MGEKVIKDEERRYVKSERVDRVCLPFSIHATEGRNQEFSC
jgi:hypothetical protein